MEGLLCFENALNHLTKKLCTYNKSLKPNINDEVAMKGVTTSLLQFTEIDLVYLDPCSRD